MKETLLVLGLLLTMTGCSAPAKSLRPLIATEQATATPGISGTWEDDDGHAQQSGGASWTLEEQKNHEYKLTVQDPEHDRQYVLTVRVASIGNYSFADITLNDIIINGEKVDSDAFWLPIHYFGRIEAEQDEIRVRLMGDDWLKAAVEKNQASLRYEKVEDDYFLTATTSELQEFVLQHGWDDEVFSYTLHLWRRPPDKK